MNYLKQYLVNLNTIYRKGKRIHFDDEFRTTAHLSAQEILKQPRRTVIINHFISLIAAENYLEIGVRDPRKNFNRIDCKHKFSVDPGIEYMDNPVDFKMTSDLFFKKLKNNELNLKSDVKFDVIYIDGLHISHQVDTDILNSIEFLSEYGVIILHDCNPPSEYHQREKYSFFSSPARNFWNGTTWKAFYKFRHHKNFFSICFDTDWGVGILSKKQYPFFSSLQGKVQNEYYEFSVLNEFRKEHLNLYDFEQWAKELKK